MNRIILIGNGFDLAHGLKTSYKHFIDWFWEKEATAIMNNSGKNFEDEYIMLSALGSWYYQEGNTVYQDLKLNLKRKGITIKYKNEFLREINNILKFKNWVDIENEYYEQLKNHAYTNNTGGVEKLNEDFSQIKKELEKYLMKETKDEKLQESKIKDLIYKKYDGKDFTINGKNKLEEEDKQNMISTQSKNDTLFLNFNYTNTSSKYTLPHNFEEKKNVIHIHGKLNKNDNPIIFGYGDELDEDYSKIEKLNNNEYLRNVKSINYLKTNNYRRLLDFINSDFYQIFILGHSCGNSDRTLLNTLFEHDNCVSIKPFFYEWIDDEGKKHNNYNEIIMNISRHFKNKAVFREKVVNEMYCKPLPQKL